MADMVSTLRAIGCAIEGERVEAIEHPYPHESMLKLKLMRVRFAGVSRFTDGSMFPNISSLMMRLHNAWLVKSSATGRELAIKWYGEFFADKAGDS